MGVSSRRLHHSAGFAYLSAVSVSHSGQFKAEFAADPWAAVHEHPTAMGPGDLLDQVEADPHADEVTVFLGFDAGEPLEELPLRLRVDTEPVVDDADTPVAIALRQGDIDPPGRAGPKADSVVQELADRQVQPVGVASNRRRPDIQTSIDRQVGETPLLVFDHRLEQFDQGDRVGRQRWGPLREAGDQGYCHY